MKKLNKAIASILSVAVILSTAVFALPMTASAADGITAAQADGVLSWTDSSGVATPTYKVWRTHSNSDTPEMVWEGAVASYTIPKDTNGIYSYTVELYDGDTKIADDTVDNVIVRDSLYAESVKIFANAKGGQVPSGSWPGRYHMVSPTPNSWNAQKVIQGRGAVGVSDGVDQRLSSEMILEPGYSQLFDFDLEISDTTYYSSVLRETFADKNRDNSTNYDVTEAYNNDGYISFLVYDKSTDATMDDLWVSVSSGDTWKHINTEGGVPEMAKYLTGLKTNRWHMVTIPLTELDAGKYTGFDKTKLRYFAFGTRSGQANADVSNHELYVQSLYVYKKIPQAKAEIKASGVDKTARPYVTVAYDMAMTNADVASNYTLTVEDPVKAVEVKPNASYDNAYDVYFPNTLTLEYPKDYAFEISSSIVDAGEYKMPVEEGKLTLTTKTAQYNVIIDGDFSFVPDESTGKTKVTYAGNITSIYEPAEDADAHERKVGLIIAVEKDSRLVSVAKSEIFTDLNPKGSETYITLDIEDDTSVIDFSDIYVYVINADGKPLCEVEKYID